MKGGTETAANFRSRRKSKNLSQLPSGLVFVPYKSPLVKPQKFILDTPTDKKHFFSRRYSDRAAVSNI